MSANDVLADETPDVSVVMPIFNRRTFLAAAFDAIRAQQGGTFEVVVVDDGSTDQSGAVIRELSSAFPHRIRYIEQENRGPYGARNTGVAAARGRYIAFYDSDDLWLPHHLSTCVSALETHADVDWVYAACQIVELETQRVIEPSSFYENGRARPFMALNHEVRGRLRVITDEDAIRCQIAHGLYCGLQNSVIRRTVFDRLTLEAETRNEAEDQLFAIRALAAGFRLAYVDDVQVRYHVHSDNSSGTTQGMSLAKRRRVYEPLVAGYLRLEEEIALSARERRALRRRISHDLFWHLGYNGHWAAGDHAEALRVFRRALGVWPWSVPQWKTYLLSTARAALRSPRAGADART